MCSIDCISWLSNSYRHSSMDLNIDRYILLLNLDINQVFLVLHIVRRHNINDIYVYRLTIDRLGIFLSSSWYVCQIIGHRYVWNVHIIIESSDAHNYILTTCHTATQVFAINNSIACVINF